MWLRHRGWWMITLATTADTRNINVAESSILHFSLVVPDGLVLLKEVPVLFVPCEGFVDQSVWKVSAIMGDMGRDWAFSSRKGASELVMIQLSVLSFLAWDRDLFARLSGGVCAHL